MRGRGRVQARSNSLAQFKALVAPLPAPVPLLRGVRAQQVGPGQREARLGLRSRPHLEGRLQSSLHPRRCLRRHCKVRLLWHASAQRMIWMPQKGVPREGVAIPALPWLPPGRVAG